MRWNIKGHMKIAIFEIGNYHDSPDITKVFSSVEKAKENISPEFKEIQDFPFYHYYENESKEKWLSIKEYKIEE